MLSSIKELFSLLTHEQRRHFYTLQFMVIIMAFAEIAGIASIGPFMALIGDISILEGDNKLAAIYQKSGIALPYDFVFWVGTTVLFILSISSLFSMYTTKRLTVFSNQIGVEIGGRLLTHYMHQPWLFHADCSSSLLRNRIGNDASTVTVQMIHPLMILNSKIVLAAFISIGIFLFNPYVAITGLLIFGIAYYCLFRVFAKSFFRK